jgi:hypothetical protein
MADETIENLRERLARQILDGALTSDNLQFKVDAFKALERYAMSKKPAADGAATSPMAVFGARVKRAEEGARPNGEPSTSDS